MRRVGNRRALSRIILFNINVLRYSVSPKKFGLATITYNLWKRWRGMGVFVRTMKGLAPGAAVPTTVMIDATHQKAHRTAASIGAKRGSGGLIGRTKSGMNTNLDAATERPHFCLGWKSPAAFAQTVALQRGLTLRDLQSYRPALLTQIGKLISGVSPTFDSRRGQRSSRPNSHPSFGNQYCREQSAT